LIDRPYFFRVPVCLFTVIVVCLPLPLVFFAPYSGFGETSSACRALAAVRSGAVRRGWSWLCGQLGPMWPGGAAFWYFAVFACSLAPAAEFRHDFPSLPLSVRALSIPAAEIGTVFPLSPVHVVWLKLGCQGPSQAVGPHGACGAQPGPVGPVQGL
jgi:hypothetical protein